MSNPSQSQPLSPLAEIASAETSLWAATEALRRASRPIHDGPAADDSDACLLANAVHDAEHDLGSLFLRVRSLRLAAAHLPEFNPPPSVTGPVRTSLPGDALPPLPTPPEPEPLEVPRDQEKARAIAQTAQREGAAVVKAVHQGKPVDRCKCGHVPADHDRVGCKAFNAPAAGWCVCGVPAPGDLS